MTIACASLVARPASLSLFPLSRFLLVQPSAVYSLESLLHGTAGRECQTKDGDVISQMPLLQLNRETEKHEILQLKKKNEKRTTRDASNTIVNQAPRKSEQTSLQPSTINTAYALFTRISLQGQFALPTAHVKPEPDPRKKADQIAKPMLYRNYA